MSSSDDDWSLPPTGKFLNTQGSGTDSMLAARRLALQQQRESAARKAAELEAAAKAKERKAEATMSLTDRKSEGGVPQSSPPPTQEIDPVVINAEKIETLKRELEAKKKLLQSSREKENALLEKWRTSKAHKKAEISQLDAQLRTIWATLEEAKGEGEREMRRAQDEADRLLRQERERVEAEVKETYEPQIKALQDELLNAQQEEQKLKSILSGGEETRQLVDRAISSALTCVLQRMEGIFTENVRKAEDWKAELQQLVRNEVRTSFEACAGSEVQAEREEYNKHFANLLEFWKRAENEERDYITKMDEMLLTDLRSAAQDDLERLRTEQMSFEEMYLESRQEWALQQQQAMKRELDSALERRTAELDEQRKLRQEIHLERVRQLEDFHKEAVEKSQEYHDREMQLLKDQHANEELLQRERQKIAIETQEGIARATESIQGLVHTMNGALEALKGYKAALDEGRDALGLKRTQLIEEHRGSLEALQELILKQCVSVEEEQSALMGSIAKLQVTSETLDRHFDEEEAWLSKEEASYSQSKSEWEREYRRWKQMVSEERRRAEERFSEVLHQLQESLIQLGRDEKDLQVEMTVLGDAFEEINTAAAKSVEDLQNRENQLRAKQDEMEKVLQELEDRGDIVTGKWKELQQQRIDITREREELQMQEMKIHGLKRGLQAMKKQFDHTRESNFRHAARNLTSTDQVISRRENGNPARTGTLGTPPTRHLKYLPGAEQLTPTQTAPNYKDPTNLKRTLRESDRLPTKVIDKLRSQLVRLRGNADALGFFGVADDYTHSHSQSPGAATTFNSPKERKRKNYSPKRYDSKEQISETRTNLSPAPRPVEVHETREVNEPQPTQNANPDTSANLSQQMDILSASQFTQLLGLSEYTGLNSLGGTPM